MVLLTLRPPTATTGCRTLVPGQTLPGFSASLRKFMEHHHILQTPLITSHPFQTRRNPRKRTLSLPGCPQHTGYAVRQMSVTSSATPFPLHRKATEHPHNGMR